MGPSANKSNGSSAESTPKGVSFRRLRRSGASSGAHPTVDASAANAEYDARHRSSSKKGASTPKTDASTPAASSPNYNPKTPAGLRGRTDLRSPGAKKTPIAGNIQNQAAIAAAAAAAQQGDNTDDFPIPDFITQTDRYGNATTPRSADAIAGARRQHPTGPQPHIHVTSDGKAVDDEGHVLQPHEIDRHDNEDDDKCGGIDVDPCDALLESLRMMCCCLIPEDSASATKTVRGATTSGASVQPTIKGSKGRSQYSTRESRSSFYRRTIRTIEGRSASF